MQIEFTGTIWYWRGPAPWFFITVPEEESQQLHAIVASVTYGWGMIPAAVRIGTTTWETALFPKDGRYLVPINARVRRTEHLTEGDQVMIDLDIR